MSERLDVAVLAAGRISRGLQRASGVTAKAMIPVAGHATIDRVLAALAGAPTVGAIRVVCAAGSPVLAHVGERAVVATGPTFVDSLTTGLAALGKPARMLVVTGDLPLLTAAAVEHFCREALQSDAGIVYPIVRREDSERVFPGGRRTFVRLVDGAYTGGNVAVVSREFLETQGGRLGRAFAARKNPVRLCAMFGWGFVLRLVRGRLSLADLVARGEALLATPIRVVQSPFPEIGFDVDKPSNLATVAAWLAGREAGPPT